MKTTIFKKNLVRLSLYISSKQPCLNSWYVSNNRSFLLLIYLMLLPRYMTVGRKSSGGGGNSVAEPEPQVVASFFWNRSRNALALHYTVVAAFKLPVCYSAKLLVFANFLIKKIYEDS
jgi:hypothetical protein